MYTDERNLRFLRALKLLCRHFEGKQNHQIFKDASWVGYAIGYAKIHILKSVNPISLKPKVTQIRNSRAEVQHVRCQITGHGAPSNI